MTQKEDAERAAFFAVYGYEPELMPVTWTGFLRGYQAALDASAEPIGYMDTGAKLKSGALGFVWPENGNERFPVFTRPDADKSDAERYRWLRDKTRGWRIPQNGGTGTSREVDGFQFPLPEPVGNIMQGSVAQHLDDAIDAALSQASKGNGND